jgi:Na+/proline symporter
VILFGALLLPLLVVGFGALGNALHPDREHYGTLVGMIVGFVFWWVYLWVITPSPPKRDPHPSPDEVR